MTYEMLMKFFAYWINAWQDGFLGGAELHGISSTVMAVAIFFRPQ